MGSTTRAVSKAQANNPHYRITELILPAFTSTGLQRFEFKTTFLPHTAGRVLLDNQGLKRDTFVTADQPIEFEGGSDCEIVNASDQEIRFTVTEFK